MNPLFSIVVPVYNAEKYLGVSLDSILNQTYKSFEVILVNDCSTDNSLDICKSYASKDSRIVIIDNATNSGAAQSRNNGIDVAIGKYLCFVDADDFIELDYLEKFNEVLMVHDYDYIKSGVAEEYYDELSKILYSKECRLEDCKINGKRAIIEQAVDMELKPLFGYLYNSVYKLEIIKNNNLRLNRNLKVNEDFDFNAKYITLINDMRCLGYIGYHYAKRNNGSLSSMKSNYTLETHLLKINAFLDLLRKYDALTSSNLDKVYWMFTRFVYSCLENGDSLFQIRREKLFSDFRNHRFENLSFKQDVLVSILKNDNSWLINGFVNLISIVKKYMPILFARIKR